MNRSETLHSLLNIDEGKDLFALPPLPLLTVYDDNFFLANDYDILSFGQRRHVQQHLTKQGFKQTSGKTMEHGDLSVLFPKPNHILAQSNFKLAYIDSQSTTLYVVTPTCFGECLFYYFADAQPEVLRTALHQLIDQCPFNIEYLRCVAINSDIEQAVNTFTSSLLEYQAAVIINKFKRKHTY